jgi:hypothetical protein
MEDKLKRYEKVEFLGEGQVIRRPNMLYLPRQGYNRKPLNALSCYRMHMLV